MNLFYQPDLEPGKAGQVITLDPEESFHGMKVLRMKPGDAIYLTDGKGNLYEGSVLSERLQGCEIKIRTFTPSIPRPYRLHIAIAPTKSIDRFEWFMEKATEIGVDEVTPLICEHSERTTLRIDRLGKVLIAAMKQSMNLYLPRLNEPARFDAFLASVEPVHRFIAHAVEGEGRYLGLACKPGTETIILIGPEGDFSEKELHNARAKKFTPISLGSSRLRTETAGVVATGIVNYLNSI